MCENIASCISKRPLPNVPVTCIMQISHTENNLTLPLSNKSCVSALNLSWFSVQSNELNCQSTTHSTSQVQTYYNPTRFYILFKDTNYFKCYKITSTADLHCVDQQIMLYKNALHRFTKTERPILRNKHKQ